MDHPKSENQSSSDDIIKSEIPKSEVPNSVSRNSRHQSLHSHPMSNTLKSSNSTGESNALKSTTRAPRMTYPGEQKSVRRQVKAKRTFSNELVKPSQSRSTDTLNKSIKTSRRPPVLSIFRKPKKMPSPKQQAMAQKRMVREKMKDGDSVRSEHFTWVVTKLLGSGGFGDVYKVHKIDNKDGDTKEYAMKTEMVEGERRLLRLKIEVKVLRQCWELRDPELRKHFVEFIDRGITDKFKFIVMGLVGPSLEDIRKKLMLKNYSSATSLNVAIQTFKAIANLHTVGWLHRDIKPQNFAVGLDDREETIYILDFGISKYIFNVGTKQVKKPRESVKFLGTLRFASRACHYLKEQGRRDDLETWLYMVYDLFDNENGINWKGLDKSEVIILKEKLFNHQSPICYTIVPTQFKMLLEYVNSLSYESEPNYGFCETILHKIGEDNCINWNQRLDWAGKLESKRETEVQNEEQFSPDNRQSGTEDDEDSVDKQMLASTRHKPVVPKKTARKKKNAEDKTIESVRSRKGKKANRKKRISSKE